jgi:hypothetical protein
MAAASVPYQESGHTVAGRGLSDLTAALQRLDRLLDLAVKSMQGAAPGANTLAPFRGLFVDREQVDRLLSQQPGGASFRLGSRLLENDEVEVVPPESPLAKLNATFGLTSFDTAVALLALAPEVDLRYEKIYSYLQDDVTRKRPTVELALNLFCSSAEDKFIRRADFSPNGRLIRNRLLQILPDPNQVEPSSLAYYLKLDDQIKHLLLGQPGLDQRLAPFCQLIQPELDWNVTALGFEIRGALPPLCREARAARKPMRLYFQGYGGPEKREAAEALAHLLGCNLLVARLDRFPAANNAAAVFHLLVREAELQDALLLVSGVDELEGPEGSPRRQDLLDAVSRHSGIAILAGKRAWQARWNSEFGVIPIEFDVPDYQERHDRWQSEIARLGAAADPAGIRVLAGRFRLTPAQIAQAATAAQLQSRWRKARVALQDGPPAVGPSIELSLDDLSAAARSQCGQELAGLARKIEPRYQWADLVLPDDPKAQLHEICSQAEFRPIVYGEWGFDRKLSLGKGLNMLFAGPPGTGKTMAAEVIAHELRLDLYRIDLSQVVSKYIGETEKNLDRIFSAAEDSNAILFFDEADALFGKRSEVRDSHDRYANIEISYLLQKMEEYQGISILATNLRQNLDDAFVRRLQAIVEFPFPDEEYRRRIWETVFPQSTPLGDDVRFDLLAREVRLAGGSIKSMALAAAFYAAAEGGPVRSSHLIRAARREHQKLARSWSPGALAPKAPAVPA